MTCGFTIIFRRMILSTHAVFTLSALALFKLATLSRSNHLHQPVHCGRILMYLSCDLMHGPIYPSQTNHHTPRKFACLLKLPPLTMACILCYYTRPVRRKQNLYNDFPRKSNFANITLYSHIRIVTHIPPLISYLTCAGELRISHCSNSSVTYFYHGIWINLCPFHLGVAILMLLHVHFQCHGILYLSFCSCLKVQCVKNRNPMCVQKLFVLIYL